jgi:hypothetical protein
MKKLLWVVALVSAMLAVSGCGSNDFDVPVHDTNETNATDSNTTDINGTSPETNTTDPFGYCRDVSLVGLTTPIVINGDNETKTISATLIDKNGVGVAGCEASITAITDARYGVILSASTVRSASNGQVKFVYQAPANLGDVNKQSTAVWIKVARTAISKRVLISFDKTISMDSNVTLPFVVLDRNRFQDINVTQNSQTLTIEVRVLEQGSNTPYTQGTVKVELPPQVANGIDVGRFAEYEVAVEQDGFARFVYTGPANIKALLDQNETEATFHFYHKSNPTQKVSSTVHYHLKDDYVPSSYEIETISSDGNYTMGLNGQKQFTVYLKDDQGNNVPDSNIAKLTITSKNALVGKLLDGDGNRVDQFVLTGDDAISGKSFTVATGTYSGLLPIEIKYEFDDVNNDHLERTTIMNVVVFSGPPTAMSIVYTGVDVNETIGKYIEKFALTVTDAYNNPVNTRPFVAVGAMVEYAVDGSSATGDRSDSSPRLWHGRNDSHGKLEAVGADKAQFVSDAADIFKYIDLDNDKLVVYGAGYVYEALGKWDIESSNDTTLQLRDKYFGSDRDGLYFAVGHNNRQDVCSNDATEYVGNMKATQYQLDSNGHALMEFEYDYHLTGKDIMVWANLTGFQADNNHTGRIGEAKKHTLRGAGLFTQPVGGYSLDKNITQTVIFKVHHEKVPEWYEHAHFGYSIKSGSTCSILDIETSNTLDSRDCSYTIAYIKFKLQSPPDKGCTFDIVDINVAPEFYGVTWP